MKVKTLFPWSFCVFSLFGTRVYVDVTWPVLMIAISVMMNSLFILYCLAITTLIVFLHELGHCYVARKVGGRCFEIVITPLGGLAFVEGIKTPKQDFLISASGPLVNLILVPVLFLCYYFYPSMLLLFALVINLGILFFNCIPILPLDGGRLARVLLYSRFNYSYYESTRHIVFFTRVFIVVLMAILFYYLQITVALFLVPVAVFILFMSEYELTHAKMINLLFSCYNLVAKNSPEHTDYELAHSGLLLEDYYNFVMKYRRRTPTKNIEQQESNN